MDIPYLGWTFYRGFPVPYRVQTFSRAAFFSKEQYDGPLLGWGCDILQGAEASVTGSPGWATGVAEDPVTFTYDTDEPIELPVRVGVEDIDLATDASGDAAWLEALVVFSGSSGDPIREVTQRWDVEDGESFSEESFPLLDETFVLEPGESSELRVELLAGAASTIAAPSFQVRKEGPDEAYVDEDVDYTIEVSPTNKAARDVAIIDVMPDDAWSNSCDEGDDNVRICAVGDLEEDEWASKTVTVRYSETGWHANCAFAESEAGSGAFFPGWWWGLLSGECAWTNVIDRPEDPDPTEDPTSTEDPDPTEDPTSTEDPDPTEDPTSTEDPDPTEDPTEDPSGDPNPSEDPSGDPDPSEDPTATETRSRPRSGGKGFVAQAPDSDLMRRVRQVGQIDRLFLCGRGMVEVDAELLEVADVGGVHVHPAPAA